jgi:hypothetical protein
MPCAVQMPCISPSLSNGLYAEEICSLPPSQETPHTVRSLVSSMPPATWQRHRWPHRFCVFVDGFSRRVQEDPALDPGQFVRYLIPLQGYDQTMTFYKSRKTTDTGWKPIAMATASEHPGPALRQIPDGLLRRVTRHAGCVLGTGLNILSPVRVREFCFLCILFAVKPTITA